MIEETMQFKILYYNFKKVEMGVEKAYHLLDIIIPSIDVFHCTLSLSYIYMIHDDLTSSIDGLTIDIFFDHGGLKK